MGFIFDFIGNLMLLVVLGLWVMSSIVVVSQKRAKVVELLGKFYSIKTAGLGFIPPFPFGKIVGEVNLQIQELTIQVNAKTNDNSFIEMPVKVQYQVIESKVKESFYELDNPVMQMKSYIFNNIRSKCSNNTLDDLFTTKDTFAEEIVSELEERFSNYGFKIISVLVDEPQPSADIREAYNRVLMSQKIKEATENEAEAEKIKIVKKAEAEAESKKLQGKGIANQRKEIIDGFKASIKEVEESTSLDTKEVMNLILITQYFDTLKEIGNGSSNTIMLPSSPSAFTDMSEQIRNATISANCVKTTTTLNKEEA